MSVHGVVSLNITIVFTSGLGRLTDRALQELKQHVCLDTGIQPSHLTGKPPMVVSQQSLEKTLACLGISAQELRSQSRSRDKLAAIINCETAGSAMRNGGGESKNPFPLPCEATATGLQPVIDRIGAGIQRLEHQLQILDDAQKRLDRLVFLASGEVDWDDPVTRIRSEEALFDCD
ncbi:hypothetical protein CGMCC3_g15818 [Colletotrichum fructicola]|nr:uncharacterized protein CGMCC3_g15818 [Colletotrichum fructicola]KAE9567991.1 hypothetical protein CGMCC3_g15818 [Colletotrichum fructicola]